MRVRELIDILEELTEEQKDSTLVFSYIPIKAISDHWSVGGQFKFTALDKELTAALRTKVTGDFWKAQEKWNEQASTERR